MRKQIDFCPHKGGRTFLPVSDDALVCHGNVTCVWKKIVRLAFYSDLHATRFTLALAALVFAVKLYLHPGDIIAIGYLFSATWLACSLTQAYILITGKYHDKFAVYFATASSVWWWFATLLGHTLPNTPMHFGGGLALCVAGTLVWARTGWLPVEFRAENYPHAASSE